MRAILFDLDGTLLPMDLDEFICTYFNLLAKRFSQYDPKAFVNAVWQGTKAMITNDGTMTNETRFWNVFSDIMGPEVLGHDEEFTDFYRTDFHKTRAITGENPLAKQIIRLAHERADKVILATNPLFPPCGVESRLSWIGLSPDDFDDITTYDNCSFCKPHPSYYLDICARNNLKPADCLMVGNDLREDAWGASQVGIRTHIVTDSLITHDLDLNDWSHSTFAELHKYL